MDMPKRTFLISMLAIIVTAFFGCAQPPNPSVVNALTCNVPIQVLNLNYFPYPYLSSYSPPTSNVQNYNLRPQILQDISDAISNAPQSVQKDLCALSGIFIDPNSCSNGDVNSCPSAATITPFPYSWGYRSSNNTDQGKMYIAIPGSLWVGGQGAQKLSDYESRILSFFARQTGNPNWGSYPTASTDLDYTWASVLAAVTHELGHVKFNFAIHPYNLASLQKTYGKNYDFTAYLQPCSIVPPGTLPPNSIPDFFSGWSYNNVKKLVPKDTWRQFADQKNDDSDFPVDHSVSPFLYQFRNWLVYNPNDLLYTMYTASNQPWASFWAAWSPDEDFVETYVLYALSKNVAHLYVTINGYNSYDIIAGLASKTVLTNKIKCVANLPILS
jgi:hypothetical protein